MGRPPHLTARSPAAWGPIDQGPDGGTWSWVDCTPLVGVPAIVLLQQGQPLSTSQYIARPRQASSLFQTLIKRHCILKNQRDRATPAEGTPGRTGRLAAQSSAFSCQFRYADVTQCPTPMQANHRVRRGPYAFARPHPTEKRQVPPQPAKARCTGSRHALRSRR